MRQPKPLAERLKAPSYRVLLVMDTIGEHGPISLNNLCKRLPNVSRAGIWRAVAMLRDYGWVRSRLSDNAFELTSQLDFKLANAYFAHEATQRAVVKIQKHLAQGATQVTVGTFIAPGQLVIIESTQMDAQIGVPLSLVFDDFALAAQSKMDQTVLLKHLTAYINRSDLPVEEVNIIKTGQHLKGLQELRDTKFLTGEWVGTAETALFYQTMF